MAPEYAELVEVLVDSARYGDLEDVHAAIEHGVDVNAQDEQGRTALHMAAANGHCDVMKALLEHGANVELANCEGNTALHWACLNGQEQAVQLLMQNGASPSYLNGQDRTPVDEALTRSFQKVVDLINSFSAPSKEVAHVEVDEETSPDDAPDAHMEET